MGYSLFFDGLSLHHAFLLLKHPKKIVVFKYVWIVLHQQYEKDGESSFGGLVMPSLDLTPYPLKYLEAHGSKNNSDISSLFNIIILTN